ncbi:MAG: VanZ family protein [Marmoricola sp.]
MRWFAALLLSLYAVLVARLTVADPSAGRPFFDLLYNGGAEVSGGRLDASRLEVLGNIALFVPAGLLLAIVLQRGMLAIGLLVLVSIGIELAQQQWLPSRVPSLADVEHNGLGAVLGVVMFWFGLQLVRALSGERRSTGQPA